MSFARFAEKVSLVAIATTMTLTAWVIMTEEDVPVKPQTPFEQDVTELKTLYRFLRTHPNPDYELLLPILWRIRRSPSSPPSAFPEYIILIELITRPSSSSRPRSLLYEQVPTDFQCDVARMFRAGTKTNTDVHMDRVFHSFVMKLEGVIHE